MLSGRDLSCFVAAQSLIPVEVQAVFDFAGDIETPRVGKDPLSMRLMELLNGRVENVLIEKMRSQSQDSSDSQYYRNKCYKTQQT